ncbi:MAG: metallophosphoesterase [Candidatus Buchananbacteria bacterium RBG_13_39_9]|uniref:Metallophosphoesterase n=1 Tax=Candidatus Buchananbacteria bacterium RBG_13_39_9 TaxID=1797531 RepID=A0A1G1XN17_9BACT|nr:MAG: metallophosphoesterase [Candidatus Buchananbacteria bacterium RBG_13_39_9]
MKILFFGDIFAKIGRLGIKKIMPDLQEQYQPDLILANAENLSHGRGVSERTIKEMQEIGIDLFTSGNHVWDKSEAWSILNKKNSPLIRPANYPPGTPGYGEKIVKIGLNNLLVVNLIGRVFFREDFDDPFRTIEAILEKYKKEKLAGIIVDLHAEATSEKVAMGFYLDGKISALIGSHTHVQTADDKILDNGTAYLSDIGFIGAKNSVIGLDRKTIINNFLTQINEAAEIPEEGLCQINGVYLEINPKTQKAIKIERVNTEVEV